ncbi:MAG TPA: MATE family efflux transporter [Rhodocyclaceae bacterium]
MRELIRLAWPFFVSQLAISGGGLLDTVMAGHLSSLDLAAIGVGAAIYISVFMASAGVLLSLTSVVAHLYGGKQHDEIGEAVRQAAFLWIGLTLFVICLLIWPDPLLAITNAPPELAVKVRAYLHAMAWTVPAAMALRLFSTLSAGIGRPRAVMVFNLGALILKVPLNWIFMYGHLGAPELGAVGCGVASAIVAWVAAAAAWISCARLPDYRPYRVFSRWSRPRAESLAELLKLGLPIALTILVDVTAFTFMALFIARLGPNATGAHQIAASLAVVCFMMPLAIGYASGVLSGQALGARDPQRALAIGRRGFLLGMGCAAVVSLTLALGHDGVVAMYTHDPEIQPLASKLILLLAVYHLCDALQAVGVSILRGYKIATLPSIVYAVSQWGIGLGGGVALGLGDWFGVPMGPAGFWIAAAVSLLVAGLALLGYWWKIAHERIQKAAAPAATSA